MLGWNAAVLGCQPALKHRNQRKQLRIPFPATFALNNVKISDD